MARPDYFHVVSLWVLVTATLCNCAANLHNSFEEPRVGHENVIDLQVARVENVIDSHVAMGENDKDLRVARDENVKDKWVKGDDSIKDLWVTMDRGVIRDENVKDPLVLRDENIKDIWVIMGENVKDPWVVRGEKVKDPTVAMGENFEDPQVIRDENIKDTQVAMGENIKDLWVTMGENFKDSSIVMDENVKDLQVARDKRVKDLQIVRGENIKDPQITTNDPMIAIHETIENPRVVQSKNVFVTTDKNVINPRVAPHGFTVGLVRADSAPGQETPHKSEQLRRAIDRSRGRLRSFQALKDVETPVHAGRGEYLMQIALGTPAITYNVVMDTGSDLIWTQCDPCTKCYHQPAQIFDPSKSNTYCKIPCSSDFCEQFSSSECTSDCEYVYKYGDGSFTRGVLSSETFLFTGTDGHNMTFSKVAFGCGNDNEGEGFTQGSGIVGMGRGPLSLISQMGDRAGNKFSYCLVPIDDPGSKTSPLQFGSAAEFSSPGMKKTPFMQNQAVPSLYYLNLEGISVGGSRLDIPAGTFELRPDGSGGIFIDSGTTITFLEEAAYRSVKRGVEEVVKLEEADGSGIGLDLCYELPSDPSQATVPGITFHFAGGADFELPARNAFVVDEESGLLCLAIAGSRGLSIFGNIQQQNFHILYDLAENNLGFVTAACDHLL
ncbi:aspartic proteinase nepenthesin-1 [Cryptomeria japonica]|uniref:aspartic proteinase nepenthesin-1 n=1 Tax=Cryptomeria japonica TaxID=3369 RepID=UPI0027DA9421|nr:aspartic proteinase nepenthesin-1 [Cryptomeria japonica]